MKFFKSLLFVMSLMAGVVTGVDLNFNGMSKFDAHVQAYTSGRITTSNNVLSVFMSPMDGDGNTGKSRSDGHRQRNEVSITEKNCVAVRGDTVRYQAQLYIPSNLNTGTVPNHGWYHIFQIKKWGMDRPVITVGVKGNTLVLYRCESYNSIEIGSVNNYKNKWVTLDFTVDIGKDIKADYSLLGRRGRVLCTKSVNKYSNYIYMKLGQYRYWPNTIKESIVIKYKSVKCSKS